MLDDLRKPFFFIACALILIALLVELGATAILGLDDPRAASAARVLEAETPGYGIPSLALLDGLVVLTIALMASSLLIPERVQGRLQGLATLIVSFLLLLAAIACIFKAIFLLSLMLALLLSPIFGTIAYGVIYGHFATGAARATLGLLMLLKLGFAGCLVLAHQRFLQNKGLVLITLFSLVATLLVSFLHGFVPGFLVSIADAIAALVVGIVAAVWAIIFLVGSVISIVKAIA